MNPILPWQQKNWQHLLSYIAQKRIPQALLITGNKGLGKRQLARQFAFALLCRKPDADGLSCGRCGSCVLLKAETHPDFMQIKPEEPGKNITVNQIRSLINDVQLKPQYEGHRVVVVDPADQLNKSAANAFLKCLEEPTERTVFLLITGKPAKLPATIVSRCQKLAVDSPDKATIRDWLLQQKIDNDPELLAGLARNAPLLAREYADAAFLASRSDCFKTWIGIAKQRYNPVIVVEDWLKLPQSPPLLFWMTSWIVDLIKCRYQTGADSLHNPDLAGPLKELAQQLELRGVYKLYDLLLASQQRLDTQINKQMMFEEILILWSELNRRK